MLSAIDLDLDAGDVAAFFCAEVIDRARDLFGLP